jgi:predicted nucleic acid-binding protein
VRLMLDSNVLGDLVHRTDKHKDLNDWFDRMTEDGHDWLIPEIADYETRRWLLQVSPKDGIAALDELISDCEYIPLNTATMRRAAEFWALVRKKGRKTADDKNLDADAILAAQAFIANAVVVTENIRHLSSYPITVMSWKPKADPETIPESKLEEATEQMPAPVVSPPETPSDI